MTAFSTIPNLIITSESLVFPDDGRNLRRAEGGEIRGRNSYSETVFRIRVVAKGTVAVKQALETFYDDNQDALNVINIDGKNYNSMFLEPPAVIEKDGDIRWLGFDLLGFDADAPVPVYSLEGIGSVGQVVVNIPETVIASGVAGTSNTVAVSAIGTGNIGVTGVAGTSGIDSVTVAIGAVVGGVGSTSGIGSVTIEGKAVVSVDGVGSTSGVGAVTVSTS